MSKLNLKCIGFVILLVVVGCCPSIIEKVTTILKELNTVEILCVAILIFLLLLEIYPIAIAIPYSIVKDFIGLK